MSLNNPNKQGPSTPNNQQNQQKGPVGGRPSPAGRGGGRYQQRTNNPNQPLMNEAIKAPQVRLIGSDGQQHGIISTRDAIQQARNEDLDLVVIGMQNPPVAKIMDYGKYKFEKEKEEKEKKKKSKAQSVFKEVKMSARIDEHDKLVKQKWIQRWLEEGNKVRVVVQMRGREMQHPEIPRNILKGFLENLAEIGKPDQAPAIKQEGRMFSLHLAPVAISKK
ncbi:MAG: translation initiation factor IF-3 [Candidatus Caenarcaniphilales bacterium]|nr:translation initiation factor IF-3 [Candidatus Caenarcaniphilales bacterium]